MKKILAVILLMSMSLLILADDALDQIDLGRELYQKGKYSKAAAELNFAIKLIRQMQITGLEKLLPKDFQDYIGEQSNTENYDASLLGGGIGVEKTYRKEEYSTITIVINTESPLVASFGSMLSNPFYSAGANVTRIKTYKATVEYDDSNNSGEVKFMLDDGKTLVTFRGNDVPKEKVIEFAKSIDYTTIEDYLK
ncbi:MAG: hypothetical protein PHR06_05810 [Candidatus Cloacimonetes bacterium]|nr:hypothetical protein [Candidatus Cloacimonadota bacterium]